MLKKKTVILGDRKFFINNLNSWFSNFLIEEFRTDYIPDAKSKSIIMGTIDPSGGPLPRLFEPKETFIDVGYNYSQEVFDNDIIIFNLDDSYLPEVEFIIRGLQNIKIETEKIFILVSNVMTWAETPLKTFTEEEINQEGFNEEEVPEIIDEEEKEANNNINNINNENEEDKKTVKSKESEKDKLVKKPTKNFEAPKENIKDDPKENKGEKGAKVEEEKNMNDTQKDKKLDSQNPEDEKEGEEGEEEEEESQKNPEETQREPEKPKIKTYYYKENEYQKRIPNSRYFYYKILENSALLNNNPKLKTYIICPGFIYGCGEDFFFDYFRLAWMGHLPYIPIIGDGDNFLPTIHILDLIQVIKRVIERKPAQKYIFACDKTKNPTMKNILKSIGNSIGGLDVKKLVEFNVENADIPNYTELKLDLRIKPSTIFDDEPRRPRESLEDYKNRVFPWHCEYGIPENLNVISDEFNIYRNLKPIKIVITGPPSGGKTTLAQMISNKYKLKFYQINQFCDWVKSLNNELGQEAKTHLQEIEENITKALDDYEHRKNKRKTDPPLDTSQLKKFSSEFMGKVIKERLKIGECVTKGYIIDNYPKTYEDCVNIFGIVPEDKEKKEEITIDKTLLPDSVIIINNYTEENLRNKLIKNEENQMEIDNRFNRRLNLYKQQNEYSEENKKLLQDFYKENNIDVYFLDEQNYMLNKEEEEKKLIQFLERKGPLDYYDRLHDEDEIIPYKESPIDEHTNQINQEQIIIDGNNNNPLNNNFGLNNKVEAIKEENENNVNVKSTKENKENKENKDMNVSIKSKKKEEEELKQEKQEEEKAEKKEEVKENENKKEEEKNNNEQDMNNKKDEAMNEFIKEEKKMQDKLKELGEREKKLLEKKSEVLRRYLSENVMPLLAKGILSVCQTMPDDPVEALANFLLDNSFDLQKDSNENEKLKMKDFEKIMDNDNE